MDVVAVVAGEVGEPTLASLRRSHPGLALLPAGDSVAATAYRTWQEHRCHVLVVAGDVELPERALAPALALTADDLRIGTVSFFGDGGGFLGLAHPLDAGEATRRLRETLPELLASPIPFATGPAVLMTSSCISAVGSLLDLPLGEALVDFSLRGRRRGFFAVVDPSTACTGASAGAAAPAGEPASTLLREYAAPSSPLSTVRAAARAKVCGLRVLVDAARLGPREMGTQVATVALITALARRPDVARVCVALADDELPSYAADLREHTKVDLRRTVDRDFSPFGRVDVAHRPFQPDSPNDMEACRAVADRVAITVLDLIAYHAISYQLAPENWLTYRDWLRRSIAQADGVIAPSHDVRHQVLLERLPVDADRLLVAELGTDHLTGDEAGEEPAALAGVGDFLLVLGADYTHKNRDLAVRAHAVLCERKFDLTLVLAGTRVHGSSRTWEDEARASGQRIVDLPEVSSGERNWLLRHASVVLYPTSGEGFGLIPFEAAAFGTPAAYVPFGPLAELAGDVPVRTADWSPSSFADAAAGLLTNADLARAQVEATAASGARHTWDATAAKLVVIYRSLLAEPARAVAGPAVPATDHASEELRRLREECERVQASTAYKVANRARQVLRRPSSTTRLDR